MSVHSNVPGVKKEVLYAGKGPSPDFVKNSKVISLLIVHYYTMGPL
jgi:hypothetical protein